MTGIPVIVDLPKVSDNPRLQARYTQLRLNGESHNMAEVLALRAFPGFSTNDDFMRGRMNGEQFAHNPAMGNYYRGVAESQGVSVKGKQYMSGLASYPGDPTAWVSDKSDVLRVAKAKGLTLDGLVNYTAPQCEPSGSVEVARDILDREVNLELERSPGSRIEDVEDRVLDRLRGREDSHPLLVSDNVPSPEEVLADE